MCMGQHEEDSEMSVVTRLLPNVFVKPYKKKQKTQFSLECRYKVQSLPYLAVAGWPKA